MTAVQQTEVEVTPDGRQLWAHFSHLSYNDFDRTETLELCKVLKVFESARFYGVSTSGFLNLKATSSSQYGIFLKGIYCNFKPVLWALRREMVYPYKVSFEVTDMGKTSMTVLSRLVNKLDNQELASSLSKMVRVDRASRRPVPFPDWLIQKCTAVIEKKCPLVLYSPPEVPADSHSYDVTVAASDTDINGHTNHTSYVRYCCDAAQVMVKAGTLQGFQVDIAKYPVLEQEIVYAGESSMGDKLQVLLWQQRDHQDRVNFVIRRQKDGNEFSAVFHTYMIFGPNQLSRL